jgi:DNA-binding NtrC family response regulator
MRLKHQRFLIRFGCCDVVTGSVSGTRRELVVRQIQELSRRRKGRFVASIAWQLSRR